jgi:glycosyltransferase involved in cell wall biosynthesis
VGRGSRRGLSVAAIDPGVKDRLKRMEGRPSEVVATFDMRSSDRPVSLPGDVVVLQHEFGIYGKDDGVGVLDIADRVASELIVVFHTVLASPSDRQRFIVEELAGRSRSVIVMSEAARRLLRNNYELSNRPVESIPHGARLVDPRPQSSDQRPLILSWGLLGPGKGLETGIEALTRLRHLKPLPLYIIAGQTHPNVLRDQGEQYRHDLAHRARELGVGDMVYFVNHYLSETNLAMLLSRARVVLLPYESREQVTSGALVEALAARVPVVATRFPHALELLSAGAGELVDHHDPGAVAIALEKLLTDPSARHAADTAISRIRAQLSWKAVAARYEAAISRVGVEAGAA